MSLIDNIQADLERIIPHPQSGICQHCWRVVENIKKHECADEAPGAFIKHMGADDPNERYKRAMSYTVE